MENSENSLPEKGKKFVRYYSPEGENSAFKNLNGAFKRAVEEEASIFAAVKIKNVYPQEKYESWAENHEHEPVLEKRARLEFVKKCEELSLLPESELLKLASRSSDRLSSKFFHRNVMYDPMEAEIIDRAYRIYSSYEK